MMTLRGTTEYQNEMMLLNHHFHEWVTGYASQSMPRLGFIGKLLHARLTGLIKSLNSAYMGLNQQQQGHQSNAYTHQTTVVVIILVQMCLYILLNMWKCHRNRNLKFQKIDPTRNRTQVYRIICCNHTTSLVVHI